MHKFCGIIFAKMPTIRINTLFLKIQIRPANGGSSLWVALFYFFIQKYEENDKFLHDYYLIELLETA